MYQSQNLTPDQVDAKLRRLRMQKITYQADIRKVERNLEEIGAEKKSLRVELRRMEARLAAQEQEEHRLTERQRFLDDEMRVLKKKMSSLEDK